jgi:tartrate dehydratase alpha subunit/fumarate hydratase class I-like protein
MLDFLLETPTKNTEVINLIEEWCQDDNMKNVLYKKNGDERYPDFKLYKMIARTVNNHTPENQLNKNCFTSFISNKKGGSKSSINIDNITPFFTTPINKINNI